MPTDLHSYGLPSAQFSHLAQADNYVAKNVFSRHKSPRHNSALATKPYGDDCKRKSSRLKIIRHNPVAQGSLRGRIMSLKIAFRDIIPRAT
jgi:hypothetical protein